MGKNKKFIANVEVELKIIIGLQSNRNPDCVVGQVFKQAAEEAYSKVFKMINNDPKIVLKEKPKIKTIIKIIS